MPSTYSTSLRLELQGLGENANTWGTILNLQIGTVLEQAIAGVASVAMPDANYTLTTANGAADEARNAVITLTGALTAPRNVVVPTATKTWTVRNATTGGHPVTVKTSGGSGISVPAGAVASLYCNAVDVLLAAPLFLPASSTVVANLTGNVTGNLTGNVTGNVTGNLTGNVTGNASGTAANVTGVVALANGGTGATTQAGAQSALGLGSAALQPASAFAAAGPIGTSGLTMATARLLGRTTAGVGAPGEISVDASLSLSGGVLSASGVFAGNVAVGGAGGVSAANTAKAWVNFDGTGSVGVNQTIRSGFNVASVYKESIGVYTITFSSAMPNANYVVLGTGTRSTSGARGVVVSEHLNGSAYDLKTTTQVRIVTARVDNDSQFVDTLSCGIAIFAA